MTSHFTLTLVVLIQLVIYIYIFRVMSGPIHEVYLRGNLVDIDRNNYDSKMERKLVAPEGFPNAYVRGASGLYLRVGAHIEAADGSSTQSTPAASQSAAAVKGIHLHVVAEPCIPEGASAFGGPVTLRVIENEGQCREFIKTIPEDGSRIEWGPVYLHARPVSTAKQQQAACGISETPATPTARAWQVMCRRVRRRDVIHRWAVGSFSHPTHLPCTTCRGRHARAPCPRAASHASASPRPDTTHCV